MGMKETIQELQIHLIREKPLKVRTLKNNILDVRSIEPYGRGCVKVKYNASYGVFILYPEARRFQELQAQLERESEWTQYEDMDEQAEVALIRYLTYKGGIFHNIITERVKEPYIKICDGRYIVCQLAWQRSEGEPCSTQIVIPAKNWKVLESYARFMLEYAGYRDYGYQDPDIRKGLYDCHAYLADLAEFEQQAGMTIDEAMEKYPSGTYIRLMECLCEYILSHKDHRGYCWVRVAKRCAAHQSYEKTYGWLGSQQVELVED